MLQLPGINANGQQLMINKSRKPVQIAVSSMEGESDLLYTLCDDGTIWFTSAQHDSPSWEQLPNVPQPGDPDGENGSKTY